MWWFGKRRFVSMNLQGDKSQAYMNAKTGPTFSVSCWLLHLC